MRFCYMQQRVQNNKYLIKELGTCLNILIIKILTHFGRGCEVRTTCFVFGFLNAKKAFTKLKQLMCLVQCL